MTAAKQFPLSVVIGAVDKISAPLLKARRSIQKTFLPILKLQRSLVGISRASGLDRVATQMGTVMQRARGVAGAVGSLTKRLGLMGAAAATAFGALLHSFTQAGDRLLSTSKKLGVTVEWLQEMQYAAERTGTPVEALEGSLGRFSRNIADAAAGLGASRTAFDALGISVVDQSGRIRKADAVFEDVVRSLSALESQELRNAMAMRLFGRAGVELMPLLGEGAAEIARLRARAHELGLVMSADAVAGAENLGDSLADLRAAGTGLTRTFLTALTPALTAMTDQVTQLVVQWGPRVRAWSEDFAAKLPERLAWLRKKFDEVWAALGRILAPVRALADRFGAANVAAVAIAAVLGGPLLLSVTALGFALVKLGALLFMAAARLWIASGAGARLNAVMNGAAAMIGKLIPVLANFAGFALGRMIAVLRLVGTTIWTKVIPAFLSWTAAILTNPLTWLVLGIAAVIAAIAGLGIWIYKHLDAVKGWFLGAYEWIAGIFSGLGDWVAGVFTGAWEAVKSAFAGVFGWIGDKISWLTSWIPSWVKDKLGLGGDTSINVASPGVARTASSTVTQRQEAHLTVRVQAPKGTRADLKADRGMNLDYSMGVVNATAG